MQTPESAAPAIELDPVSLILNSSGPVFVVVWLLMFASVLVWLIAVAKLLQLARWRRAQRRFNRAADQATTAEELFAAASEHAGAGAPGARIVAAIAKREGPPEVLSGAAKRAVVAEQQRASTFMPILASIGSASPFVGLFGTVYGIMDAFLRIGREKSASLPVVAPAIGEALIATAIGLFAAIPAVIAYNAIAKRIDDLLSELEAASEEWVALATHDAGGAGQLGSHSAAPPPLPQG